MSKREITEKYKANIHLNSLYDVLVSLKSNGKYWYPDDINKDINNLISKINRYIYHDHKGYDVINETWYSEFVFKRNDNIKM
jgi:hypothetical protein